ncbi:hypothetical protein [Sphingomonas sp. KR3-1]|uniref:hypothetical protein n=1 Tax=Sphingomonas sp. KR3-1 TaxID=3156611 RepID=UPI0032B56F2B
MNQFDSMRLVYLLGALVLVTSGFWGRRIGMGQLLRMALAWLGIFAIAYLIAVNVGPIGRALGVTPAATASRGSV